MAIEKQQLGHRKSVPRLVPLSPLVAILASCTLTPPGELGTPVFSVPFLLEDATLLSEFRVAAAWETDAGLHFVYADTDDFFDSVLGVYESAPDEALGVYDGAARLVFFAGSERRLAAENEGGNSEVDEPLAQSRSSIWSLRRSGARLPFATPDTDGEGHADVLFVDNADPVARRCADDAVTAGALCVAGGGGGCDVDNGFVDAAAGSCCEGAQAAFVDCNALVAVPFAFGELDSENPPPVRLRVFP